MKHDFTPPNLRRKLEQLSDINLLRTRYCYQIGSTFVACALLEDSVITSMLICDRVKIASILRDDAPRWEQFILKKKHLQDSTLGSLISLLAKHNIAPADLNYLRWLKSKRDFFIHRFFHNGAWPGDLNEEQVSNFCRSLGALEIIFCRGAERMIHVLARADLIKVEALSEGYLALNPDAFDKLHV
jgi:hypothetical protein